MNRFSIFGVLLITIALMACDSSSDNDQSTNTRARFVNLITNSDNVTFEVDESVKANKIGFRRSSVLSNVSGVVELDLELIDSEDEATTLVNDQQETFDGDVNYTVFATGTAANASLVVTQRSRTEPETDFTRMQFINATGSAVSVSMHPALSRDQEVYSDSLSALSADTDDDYLSQSVFFRVRNTADTLLLETVDFSLESDESIAVVVTDYVGPVNAEASVDLIILENVAETKELVGKVINASIRFVNSVANVPTASIRLSDEDGVPSNASVPFTEASERANIDAGLYEIDLADANAPNSSLFNTDFSLLGGFDYTYLLTGDIGSPEGILIIDELREVATNVQLKFLHASVSLGDVDIYISNNLSDPLSGSIIRDLSYRSQRTINLAGDSYSITATAEGGNAIVAGPFLLQLSEGEIVDLLLHEDELSGAPFSFRQF